jgi:hypothetical protein
MALLDGDVTVMQFEKDRWRDSVMALVEKTSVKPGEALIAKMPKGRGAGVELIRRWSVIARDRGNTRRGRGAAPIYDLARAQVQKLRYSRYWLCCGRADRFAGEWPGSAARYSGANALGQRRRQAEPVLIYGNGRPAPD